MARHKSGEENGKENVTKTFKIPNTLQIDGEAIDIGTKDEYGFTDPSVENMDNDVSRDRAETEYESDKGYRKITESIIEISGEYLRNQHSSKKPLRSKFFWFFAILLGAQYLFLVLFITGNSFIYFPFYISQEVLRLYIVSVFVETLSAMAVMIAFAFASKDENQIVTVLNNIVSNYQKVNLGDNQKNVQPKKEKDSAK